MLACLWKKEYIADYKYPNPNDPPFQTLEYWELKIWREFVVLHKIVYGKMDNVYFPLSIGSKPPWLELLKSY